MHTNEQGLIARQSLVEETACNRNGINLRNFACSSAHFLGVYFFNLSHQSEA